MRAVSLEERPFMRWFICGPSEYASLLFLGYVYVPDPPLNILRRTFYELDC